MKSQTRWPCPICCKPCFDLPHQTSLHHPKAILTSAGAVHCFIIMFMFSPLCCIVNVAIICRVFIIVLLRYCFSFQGFLGTLHWDWKMFFWQINTLHYILICYTKLMTQFFLLVTKQIYSVVGQTLHQQML